MSSELPRAGMQERLRGCAMYLAGSARCAQKVRTERCEDQWAEDKHVVLNAGDDLLVAPTCTPRVVRLCSCWRFALMPLRVSWSLCPVLLSFMKSDCRRPHEVSCFACFAGTRCHDSGRFDRPGSLGRRTCPLASPGRFPARYSAPVPRPSTRLPPRVLAALDQL